MQNTKVYKPYRFAWKWHSLLLIFAFLTTVLLRSQGLIVQLFRPLLLSVALLFTFHLICRFALRFARAVEKRLQIEYPSLFLWLYPTLVLLTLAIFSFVLIIGSNSIWGRGFWSNLLRLNSQETTSFFSTCFATMILFTALHFFGATFATLSWIADSSKNRISALDNLSQLPANAKVENCIGDAIKKMRAETDFLQQQRTKATRINRYALLSVFSLMLSGTIWIIFFRPAVVLYYRAEIQLRTFLEPQTALETFKHLTRKYPDYRYIDSVRYRMAWIQDRRLNLHQKAAASYQVFLKQHNKSVWIDEALVNLVRLYVDCLQKPEMGLETIDRYEKKFPSGVFLPHMQLYKIRALAHLNRSAEARSAINAAIAAYGDKKIQITNSEDRLIELLDFSEAIKAEITANANLQ
jgi:hypothetical protein